ncbi:hypothetical protein BESB_074110 [Besnoitia besnoiti]|uniref:Uncharacterized protein n=1 Tax=Besnoitia besnoiti TaxID=94643 RepID=A0A2A9M8L6_BESBE|nr:uncharacterized protein BESB_074110 [Besnoitia besnoiti]PFH34259.1 hypothetical protein BESB_074110 [Besnoitia besnoiti]
MALRPLAEMPSRHRAAPDSDASAPGACQETSQPPPASPLPSPASAAAASSADASSSPRAGAPCADAEVPSAAGPSRNEEEETGGELCAYDDEKKAGRRRPRGDAGLAGEEGSKSPKKKKNLPQSSDEEGLSAERSADAGAEEGRRETRLGEETAPHTQAPEEDDSQSSTGACASQSAGALGRDGEHCEARLGAAPNAVTSPSQEAARRERQTTRKTGGHDERDKRRETGGHVASPPSAAASPPSASATLTSPRPTSPRPTSPVLLPSSPRSSCLSSLASALAASLSLSDAHASAPGEVAAAALPALLPHAEDVRRMLLLKAQASSLSVSSPLLPPRVARLRSPPLRASARRDASDDPRYARGSTAPFAASSSFSTLPPRCLDVPLGREAPEACSLPLAASSVPSSAAPASAAGGVSVLSDRDVARLLSRRLRITTRAQRKSSLVANSHHAACCAPARAAAGHGGAGVRGAEAELGRFADGLPQMNSTERVASSFLAWSAAARSTTTALDVSGGELLRRGRKRKRAAALLDKLQILRCLNCGEVARGGYKFGDYVICCCCGENNFAVVREWSPGGEATTVGGDRGQAGAPATGVGGGAVSGRRGSKREIGIDSRGEEEMEMSRKILESEDSSEDEAAGAASVFHY